MADATRTPKVQMVNGGNEQIVASGGKITVESGGKLALSQGALMEWEGNDVAATMDSFAELDAAGILQVAGFMVAGDPVSGVRASLLLDSVPAASDLTLTAVAYGTGAHAITAQIFQGVGNNVPLSVAVAGNAITITLPTDGAGAAVAKTANEVKAAYDAVPAAVALATITVEGTGVGTVDAAAVAPLANGVDVTAGPVPCLKLKADGTVAYVKVSAQVWKKFALAAL